MHGEKVSRWGNQVTGKVGRAGVTAGQVGVAGSEIGQLKENGIGRQRMND